MKLIFTAIAFGGLLVAQGTKGTILLTRDLPELAGKEGTMLTVNSHREPAETCTVTTPMCLFTFWKVRSQCR